MEAPPPYRQKKSNTGLIIGLIIGGVLICCGGPVVLVGGGLFWGLKTFGPIATCGIGIQDVQRAIRRYADDHDGRLPAAATWQDDVKSYYVKESQKHDQKGNPIEIMPAEGNWGCKAGDASTGFAYNVELAGKKLDDIKDKDTPLVFEVPQVGHNLAMKYVKQDPEKSPKLMNDRRGWFIAPVEGDVVINSKKGGHVKFQTGT